jgi:putative transcriptional regulator
MDPLDETYTLAPALLLSMPLLVDPNFRLAVVLLCEHTSCGEFVLVLNLPRYGGEFEWVGV